MGSSPNPPPVTCASASLATSQLMTISNKLLRHPSGRGIRDLDLYNAAGPCRMFLLNVDEFEHLYTVIGLMRLIHLHVRIVKLFQELGWNSRVALCTDGSACVCCMEM